MATDREVELSGEVMILSGRLNKANETIRRDRETFDRLWDIICRLSVAGREVGHGGPISIKG